MKDGKKKMTPPRLKLVSNNESVERDADFEDPLAAEARELAAALGDVQLGIGPAPDFGEGDLRQLVLQILGDALRIHVGANGFRLFRPAELLQYQVGQAAKRSTIQFVGLVRDRVELGNVSQIKPIRTGNVIAKLGDTESC